MSSCGRRSSVTGLRAAFLGGAWAIAALSDPLERGPEVLQVGAREVWVAPGRVEKDAVVVVEGGRIRAVVPGSELRTDLPFLRYDGVLTAGLIACRSQSGTRNELQDDTRTVLPRARAEVAVDGSSADLERALAAGITALVLSPGPANLVGGLSCVIRSGDGRVLASEAGLALSLSGLALSRSTSAAGFFFGRADESGTGIARPDGGPEDTRLGGRGTREPTGYAGAVTDLRQLISRGEEPFSRAREGELPVTIEAWDRHEVVRAAGFAKELGLRGAIRGAPLAGDPDVVAALKESGLGVILGPYGSEQSSQSLEALSRLEKAGVRVGFALDAPQNSPDELRLTAARALRTGATHASVWRALTEDAAHLAGVGGEIGKLEAGYRADFVLWSGDPLDLSSKVLFVYLDGERVWPRAGRP